MLSDAIVPLPYTQKAKTLNVRPVLERAIVFMVGSDPVEMGLVASLNHPGGNATGISLLNKEVAAKRVELLHELVPAAKLIARLYDPTNRGSERVAGELQFAARVLGLDLMAVTASDPQEIEQAFATLIQRRVAALVVSGEPFFVAQRDQIVALAARHAVSTIYSWRTFTDAGGLMSYGTDPRDAERRVGVYTGRILNGEKPAELPVQQASKIQLILNIKTAKALGLTIPETLLATADEVIQ